MPQQPDYSLTPTDLTIQFLKASQYGNYFKKFFYGNPDEGVGVTDCPCIAVVKETTKVKQDATGMDSVVYNLLIRVIINKRTYLTMGDIDTAYDQKQVELMIEGRDPVTGLYATNTILQILRTNFTLNLFAVDQEIDIQYGRVINPMMDEITREAQVRMVVSQLVMTPNKQ